MESDEDIDDVEEEKVKVEEVVEDEIIESDVELEGDTVEPDDDPPQKVLFLISENKLIFVAFEFSLKANACVVSDGRSLC